MDKSWPRFSADLVVSLLILALVTLFGFYIPQTKHFWGGYDDFSAYQPTFLRLWSETFDVQSGRPFLGWSYVFGWALAGGRIEGFIAFAALVCFVNAVLLCVYLRGLLPNAKALALASAVLLIVNRADPLKFYPLWAASPYCLAVCFLLLAMWLFHVSWCRQHRGLLLMSCASLGATLLMYEVGYLLALIPILALWIDRRRYKTFLFWAYSWIATLCLFAIRVVIFQLTSNNSYQLNQASESQLSFEVISRNTLTHLKPIEMFFRVSSFTSSYISVALPVFFVVAVGVWWVERKDKKQSLSEGVLVPIFAAMGILLAIAPYTHISGKERTQFFASPSQAVLIAYTIGLFGIRLPKSIASISFGLVVGLLAANATVESYHLQDRKFHVTFDKAVHVCQQILAITSRLTDEDLVILLHNDPSPLGASYCIFSGGLFWTGAHIVPIGESSKSPLQIDFDEDSAMVNLFAKAYKRYSYRRMIVFRLDQDGTLYFETKWPADSRLPKDANGYAPLKLLSSRKIVLPTDFNFPTWSGPPNDVVCQREGIVLGRGWTSLQFENGWLYRNAKQDAEFIVNSQGESQIEWDLDMEPMLVTREGDGLEVVNSGGDVVAKRGLRQRQAIRLQLPCSQDRIEVFRIRFASDSRVLNTQQAVFKVYSTKGPLSANPLASEVADIAKGGVQIGSGWYPLETYNGKTLRWLNTDGKILTGPCSPGEAPGLLLEATAGPGMDGQPFTVELRDANNVSVATKTVVDSNQTTLRLPVDFEQLTELSLHIRGGGKQTKEDPRILNLMVTKCEWQAKVIEPPDILKGPVDLGTGWYPYEFFGGEHFRWINTNAQIVYQAKEPVIRSSLVLDVSPGPGLNGMAGAVEVVDSQGNVLASASFDQRTQLTLELNDLSSGRNVLELRVIGGGNTIPNDPRVLNVQVFQCEWRIETSGN